MRNIKMTIEYDGSRYDGWTRHGKENSNTISSKITEVLNKMTGEEIDEICCGCRTETGVHAYAQTANFKTDSNLSIDQFKQGLNRYLPMDIAITDLSEVSERFHSQLNAVSKTFVYRMTVADVPSVFDRKHCFHCYRIPDRKSMQEASSLFIGKHDFANFSTARGDKSTIREVYEIDIYGDSEEMHILIRANDFLYNMSRAIIGTLLDIGNGAQKKEIISDIFEGAREKGTLCDPQGLYLLEVDY